MKEALDAAGIKKHLMVQPLGYLTPDAGKQGFIDLPEFPFGNYLVVKTVSSLVHQNDDLRHDIFLVEDPPIFKDTCQDLLGIPKELLQSFLRFTFS